jgi:hypothetical protein
MFPRNVSIRLQGTMTSQSEAHNVNITLPFHFYICVNGVKLPQESIMHKILILVFDRHVC